jgi:hypothetical protein
MLYKIKKEEILGYFHDIHASKLLEILEKIKNHCEGNNIPLLNNPNSSMQGDFVELIMDCLDLNLIFTENNKLN